MTIAIVSGSHKTQGESVRLARFLEKKIQQDGHDAWVLDLAETQLPLWDEGMWGKEGLKDKWSLWQPIAEKLQACTGLIVIAPEYAGMVPSSLKNFFLLAGTKELAHKPGLIVSVSASRNGAYPVAELRMSSTKNNKLCYMPDHLIIRNVEQMLQEVPPQDLDMKEADEALRERVDYTLKVFYSYVEALSHVRASGTTETKKFAYGM